MSISDRDNNITFSQNELNTFLDKVFSQNHDYVKWYKQHIKIRFYNSYFKNNDKLLLLVMLKPKMLINAYEILKKKNTYWSSTNELFNSFLNYLNNSSNLLDFLLEYSYSYSEKLLLNEINKKSTNNYNDVYYYLFTHVPLIKNNYLRKTFQNISEFTDDMFSFDSNRNTYSSSSSSSSSPSTMIGTYKKSEKSKKKKNKKSSNKNNGEKKKNKSKTKVKSGQYYNTISKKVRPLDKSYYTKKYKELIDSYPENKIFSKCQSKAPDSYRKYRCNFFYDNCPNGWQSEHNGDISRCNCNGSSYKYYNNIFDCNPSLGVISSGLEKESGTCQDKPETKEEFAVCFNKAYSQIKKLHQKNNEYYDKIIKSNNEKTKSELNTFININETFIKKSALKLKSQFPRQDYSEYIDFAEFIEGYLADPLNFIE